MLHLQEGRSEASYTASTNMWSPHAGCLRRVTSFGCYFEDCLTDMFQIFGSKTCKSSQLHEGTSNTCHRNPFQDLQIWFSRRSFNSITDEKLALVSVGPAKVSAKKHKGPLYEALNKIQLCPFYDSCALQGHWSLHEFGSEHRLSNKKTSDDRTVQLAQRAVRPKAIGLSFYTSTLQVFTTHWDSTSSVIFLQISQFHASSTW